MEKRLAFLVSILGVGVFVAFHFAQPPFRVHRKLLVDLSYNLLPNAILVTDLDMDGHPEVMVIATETSFSVWVRSLFGKPSSIRLTNIQHFEDWGGGCECAKEEAKALLKKVSETPLRALPVLVAGNRLRLLRWRGGRAVFERLSPLPDVPINHRDTYAGIWHGHGTGNIFLTVATRGEKWFFVLTSKGEWRFVGKWREVDHLFDADIADIDRDRRPDLLAFGKGVGVRIFWGGRKGSANLGTCCHYLRPLVADLDGDGWLEVTMVAEDKRLQIWRFNPHQKKMRLLAVSLPFSLSDLQEGDELRLADLDGDGKKEIIVPDDRGSAVVQFRDGKLRVWKGKADKIWGMLLYTAKGTKFYESDIMTRGGKDFTILWVLPKGKRVLSPSNWRRQEVPIRFEFVGDIDGDGSDEVLGYDSRWNCYRLYRVHPVKSGLLHWESVYLGKDIAFPLVFATIKDGSRRGLVMAVETKGKFKRLELLTVEGTR
jgi:hypothetical protein